MICYADDYKFPYTVWLEKYDSNWILDFPYTVSLKKYDSKYISSIILPDTEKLFGKSLFPKSKYTIQNENAAFEYYKGYEQNIYFKHKEDALIFKLKWI